MNMNFYDIESLSNVFTLANFKEQEEHVEIFILCDDEELINVPNFGQLLLDCIYKNNLNFNGTISLYDLKTEEGCNYLAETFGLSDARLVNDKKSESNYPSRFRPVCDTDPEYIQNPDAYPYFGSYNGANYDTTMLACFEHEVFFLKPVEPNKKNTKYELVFTPTTAKKMREINDDLFSDRFKDSMPSYLATRQTPMMTWSKPDYQDPRWRIRKNLLMTGRQIDISNLNEKQRKVGLKRLLGMMGFQILESDKLGPNNNTVENLEQLVELIAYNISDVVNLAELFKLDLYQAQFTLKRQLLHTYPELIYEKLEDKYAPDIRPEKVRRDRLFIDSTSSQFAQKALCPYDHLSDMQAVSFNYPHPEKAKELGIKTVNVLEEAKKFFYSLYPQPEVRAAFDNVYNYYKSIEGKNFNESQAYRDDFMNNALPLTQIGDIPKTENCIPYFDKDGNPTSCFATFSIGGVHGAEYNYELFYSDLNEWQSMKDDFDYVMSKYPDPVQFRQTCGTKPKEITLPNGDVWKMASFNRAAKMLLEMTDEEKAELLATPKVKGKTKQNVVELINQYPNVDDIVAIIEKPLGVMMPDGRLLPVNTFLKSGSSADATYKNIDDLKPVLFKQTKKESWKLNEKYVFTSADEANHEDFTSYYPNLLRMMMAFYNPGLGYDRYAEIFYQKQDYGFLMKPKNQNLTHENAEKYKHLRMNTGLEFEPFLISKEERDMYSVLREGTKLILNSASGAGDATFDNNIRMNNTIISMRIIGQLFSWRIGQAQSYQGAKITSTNTDGLYSVMEASINDKILAQESESIGVEIEPEPMYLISKDTNNRMELDAKTFEITAASGGTLGCRKGPRPDKSLAHPAIIDWALAEYLTVAAQGYKGLSLDKPFNETIGMNILKASIRKHDTVEWLRMFQNVLASSPGSVRYIYGLKDENPTEPIILPHYNRVFYMKPNTPNTMHLWAAFARVINESTRKNRRNNNLREVFIEPIPLNVLRANGVTTPPPDKDITTVKVTGIEDDWNIFIQNKDLNYLTQEEYEFILYNLDYDNYLKLLKDGFENNWRNKLPNRHYIQFMNFGECIATETVMNNATTASIQMPTVPKPNEFAEWNTEPDGTGMTLTDNMPLTEDMVVYSVYQSDKIAAQAAVLE